MVEYGHIERETERGRRRMNEREREGGGERW